MPDSISDPQLAPAAIPVNAFFDQVIHAVHRHKALARNAEEVFGAPYVYDLDSTASFSGLPVHLLRRLCRTAELQAIKLSGRWLLHRDDFNRLLAPDVMLPSRAARQYILLRNLQQLAALLHPHDAASVLYVLLHDLRRAVMFRLCGAAYDDAEGMVSARAEWRIRDGIVDQDQIEEALRLLQAIIELGMELFQNTDWRHARLVSMIAEGTSIDLGSGPSPSLPIDATDDCPLDLSFAF